MVALSLGSQQTRSRLLEASPPVPWFLIAGLTASALILGGGTRSGQWSDAIVQLLSLVVLFAAVGTMTVPRRLVVPLIVIGAAFLIPLVQLLPLPPSLWNQLPGRSAIVENFDAAGIALPWMPVTLSPQATWQAMFSLLPATAVFLAAIQLSERSRRGVTLIVTVIVILSVLLGLAQLVQGSGTQLRLFPYANAGDSVGFFANRNHYAALLYATIPFVAAWIVGLFHDQRPERLLGLVAGVLVLAAIILGLAMARSRAGVLLAGVTAMGSLLIAARHGGKFARRGLVAVSFATVIGVLLAINYAFFSLASRFDDSLVNDFRWTIAAVSLEAARAFQPIGAGLGSFVPVYQMFEPIDAILPTYINHAHNDWIELYLEAGWPGMAVVLIFLLWFGLAAARAWFFVGRRKSAVDRAISCGASMAVFALLLHSAVDYPLRTTAIEVLFALSCAFLIEPVPHRETTASGSVLLSIKRMLDRRRRRRGAAWSWRRYG